VASTLGRISDVVDEVLATAGVDRERMLGVGIAAPGPVDLDSGTVIDPPLLEGWRHVAIRDELARRLGMPALLEKDVTAAAVAETWMGAASEHGNLVFFYYGTGAGVGLVVQNEVIRGVSSNAGDVGNLVVAGGKAGGHRLRLGDAIIPRLLVADAIERGVIAERGDRTTIAGVREHFAALAAAERAGDAGAVALLDGVADDIATALVTIVNLLDVERVVFGGPFFAPVADALLERIPSRVGTASGLVAPHPVAFVASTIGDDVAAVGAACLVLDHAFSPRPAGLLIKR
jgi:predicted NBD/HSP70 family sugar kinase